MVQVHPSSSTPDPEIETMLTEEELNVPWHDLGNSCGYFGMSKLMRKRVGRCWLFAGHHRIHRFFYGQLPNITVFPLAKLSEMAI